MRCPQPTCRHGRPIPAARSTWPCRPVPKFQELRRTLRRFVFPMTAFFLIWYVAYVLLGAFAHDFMAIKVLGNINIGLLIGLRPVRDDVPHHRPLRPVRQPGARPAAEAIRAEMRRHHQ